VVLRGIVGVLGMQPDMKVVAICSDGVAAELPIKKHAPQIAILVDCIRAVAPFLPSDSTLPSLLASGN